MRSDPPPLYDPAQADKEEDKIEEEVIAAEPEVEKDGSIDEDYVEDNFEND